MVKTSYPESSKGGVDWRKEFDSLVDHDRSYSWFCQASGCKIPIERRGLLYYLPRGRHKSAKIYTRAAIGLSSSGTTVTARFNRTTKRAFVVRLFVLHAYDDGDAKVDAKGGDNVLAGTMAQAGMVCIFAGGRDAPIEGSPPGRLALTSRECSVGQVGFFFRRCEPAS